MYSFLIRFSSIQGEHKTLTFPSGTAGNGTEIIWRSKVNNSMVVLMLAAVVVNVML